MPLLFAYDIRHIFSWPAHLYLYNKMVMTLIFRGILSLVGRSQARVIRHPNWGQYSPYSLKQYKTSDVYRYHVNLHAFSLLF